MSGQRGEIALDCDSPPLWMPWLIAAWRSVKLHEDRGVLLASTARVCLIGSHLLSGQQDLEATAAAGSLEAAHLTTMMLRDLSHQ